MLATRWAAVDAALAHAPSLCAVCRGWGRGRVCAACLDRFAARTPRCERCALPLPLPATVCGACTREPPPFDAALAAVDYATPWDRLVTAFKFHDAIDLARPFARAIGPLDFWTEAALWTAHGKRAIVIGPGDIARAHAADEYVELDDLEWAVELFRAMLA